MPTRKKNRAAETTLSKGIQQALAAKGCRVIRIQSGVVPALYGATKRYIHCAPAGTPDLLCIRPATSMAPYAITTWIEVKTKTGKLSKKQKEWHEWASLNGVRVATVRSISEAIAFVFRVEDNALRLPA